MKLICATCKKEFSSLIIDKMMAWNDCFTKVQKHVSLRHPDVVANLQMEVVKAMSSVTAFMTVTTLCEIPEDEKYIHLLLSEFQDEIMMTAGFEPGEVEEEDEDEDEVSKPELPEDVPSHKEESDEEEAETHVMPKPKDAA